MLKALFANAPAFADSYEESGEGHGRAEHRRCDVLSPEDTRFLMETKNFPHLKSVIRVTAGRGVKEKITEETRYFLSSAPPDAKAALRAVRWGIENSLHWTLDVSFREDASRIRKDNAPFCMAVMRHIAFNLIQQAGKKGTSLNRIRKKAAYAELSGFAASPLPMYRPPKKMKIGIKTRKVGLVGARIGGTVLNAM